MILNTNLSGSIALKTNPEMVMLVPEGRREITTEGGLDLVSCQEKISKMVTHHLVSNCSGPEC